MNEKKEDSKANTKANVSPSKSRQFNIVRPPTTIKCKKHKKKDSRITYINNVPSSTFRQLKTSMSTITRWENQQKKTMEITLKMNNEVNLLSHK